MTHADDRTVDHGSRLSVLIVDGTCLYREALAADLRAAPWIGDLRAEPDATAAVLRLQAFRPDIALVHADPREGVAVVTALRTASPGLPVLVLGADEVRDEDGIVAYAEAGVAGFLGRGGNLADLEHTVSAALRGESLCSPRIAGALLRRVSALAASPRTPTDTSSLTPREREVLVLIERGMSNKQIAATLSIEVRTVKNHVHNLLEKLRVTRRGEAAACLRATSVPSLTSLLASSSGTRTGY